MAASTLSIDEYRGVAPKGTVEFLLRLAERVRGRRFLHVNSTRAGGGVAEILHRLIPMMRDVGIQADWEVIEGDPEFFATTKAFHNALQGTEQVLTDEMLEHYHAVNRTNAERLRPAGDLVLIHDPQPAAMVEARPAEGKWVWRCHIDLSAPQRRVWAFLRRFVLRYDAAVFSLPAFAHQLPLPQFLVYPSIDPLAEKNRRMSKQEVAKILRALQVPDDKPLLLQVSRFDRFKDPLGVINAYRIVKRYHDVRLILAGGGPRMIPRGPRSWRRSGRRPAATPISSCSTCRPTRTCRSTPSSAPPPSSSKSPRGRDSASPWRRPCGRGNPSSAGRRVGSPCRSSTGSRGTR